MSVGRLCVHFAVTSLSPFTLSPHVACALLQVKEEDEDAAKGVEENTMVLYLFYNKFHCRNKYKLIYKNFAVNSFALFDFLVYYLLAK